MLLLGRALTSAGLMLVPEYDVDWALFLSGLESARLIYSLGFGRPF